ncbi:MAG: iron-containing alcohol dehydrogenase [Anaeromicrobium sp.]|jgi:alcohol dehydrogenase|uniref:iron-containing alcohol dehydrogenase n=1 Tax=Anaeromicrobium sp. TaxID=1929132 RepID=UPI0025E801A8|nr:iron-containing alcohol dehydrogenase [Anaeromicrobium sp.]MCT4593910.1 iron-containing alcohol dehydrogenase [Anaeromicrobium sp.]
MKNFDFSVPTKVLFGEGKLNELKDYLGNMGKKGLLVTGKSSMRKTGVLDRVIKLGKESGVEIIVNEGVEPNPTSDYINHMSKLVRKEGCDFLIGLGGGSPMDAAKAISLLAINDGVIEDYLPGGKYEDMANVLGALPIVAITTTAGTGSEVTMFSVITNKKTKEKPGIGHQCLFPVLSIIDPELMVSVPKHITLSTGVDVLFHALEAYICTVATPLTDMYALEAIKLVLENLGDVLEDGSNLEKRSKVAWANTLAGMAIVQASTVGIHGMGHPIGGHTNSPHGMTMAALGKAFLDKTYDGDIDRYSNITKILGYDCEGLSKKECAAKSGEALQRVLDRFGAHVTISDLGVKEDMIETLAKDAFKTMGGCMAVSLKELDVEDAISIYKSSL